jgi:hypothetical protein
MPSRRSRKTITKQFNYDERVEAEEKRKSSSKKRGGRAQPGCQRQKARKKVVREAMTAPASSAVDDISMAPNDSSQELKKNLHLEQECSISAQDENAKIDDIPSPPVEVTITRPKKHQRSSGPKKKSKREDSRDDGPSMSAPPRGFEVELTKIQEKEELSSGRASYFSDMYKSSDDFDSSDDEAEMRRTAKRLAQKIPKHSRQTANGGGPRSSVVARVSASSGDYSNDDEYSIPTLQVDADCSGRTVQSSKKSDSATEMKSDPVAETKWSSVAFTSGAMDSLMQALQDDIGKIVKARKSTRRGKKTDDVDESEAQTENDEESVASSPRQTRRKKDEDDEDEPVGSRARRTRPSGRKSKQTGDVKRGIAPNHFDVLFGVGKTLAEHTGNMHANHLVASYGPKYDKADKQEKTDITWHIVKIIHESYDGRFMKFEENEGWVEVEPGVARVKISDIFRTQRNRARRKNRTKAFIAPRRSDVLFGTGTPFRAHVGNVHANHLVASYRPKYDKADRQEKTNIAWHIVKTIHESYGGRFMKFEENEGWVEVELGKARKRISYMFRNQRNGTRRNMQKVPSSSRSLGPTESQLHLYPSTGVVVPTSAEGASTIAGGFLYQLTKMLSDSNREVIEWSHGESKLIVIPVPMTFRVFVMPTFEFSLTQAR